MRTALGAAVDPDVKMRRNSASGVGERWTRSGTSRDRVLIPGTIDPQDAVGTDAEVEPLDEVRLRRVRDHELAVGVPQVACQLVAPTGGVGADDDGPAEGRGREEEHVLDRVLEQHADVERPRPTKILQHGRACRGGGHQLAPGPLLTFEAQRHPVVRCPPMEDLRDRLGGRCAHGG